MTRYWHGGAPGLKPGALLLPPSITGTDRTLTTLAQTAGINPQHVRDDRVYLTTDRAAGYPNGALYVAEPLGEIEDDPDAPGLSVRCASARITAVYDPCVRWAERGTRWLTPLLRGGQ